ncbi:MAG: urate hydroxylase PuuD [Beijerinckiaceae bacterium]
MYEFAVFWTWLEFAVRWLHIITGIAWIGSSFYFIALDLSLRKDRPLPAGVAGEEWQVHGGGFYRMQKYVVAPPEMPEHLTWFKWESYFTWMSGFALLCVVYYAGAQLYMIDKNLLDVSPAVSILISLASLSIGWIIYDFLCKSPIGNDNTRLMILLYVVLVAMAWGYTQVFTGRAALLHLGAFTATIMTANVFLIIIPNQKIVVADLVAGRTPDPKLGEQAKQRSTHNNYLTLAVLFLMLSVHFPMAFGVKYNWLIAALVFLIGVVIRHYFNSKHSRTGKPMWTWFVAALLFWAIMWLSAIPREVPEKDANAILSADQNASIAAASFPAVRDAVQTRCSMCHARQPVWEGIIAPPKGVILETDADIVRHAMPLYLHAGRTDAMPPANITEMNAKERAAIVQWYRTAVSGRS